MTSSIDMDRLRNALSDTGYTRIDWVETTGSTNADLLDGPPEHRVARLAGEQTTGKGRLGRPWSSPRGGQFIASVGLVVGKDLVDRLGLLPLAVGVALTDAIDGTELKWPNDLLYDGRKLAGILVEGVPVGDGRYRVVIGFGINTGLTRQQLPVEHATSLALEGIDVDPTDLGVRVLGAVDTRVEQWLRGDPALIDDYRSVCVTVGRRVRLELPGGVVTGTVDGVGDDGRIRVDGEYYSAGDVTHLRPEPQA